MTQASTTPRVISGLGTADQPRREEARTSLPVIDLDPRTFDRALSCVHCGLCLPACPTYTQNGLEADSPRGRIMLMKGLATGKIEPTTSVISHLDLCLDCRACETACPSGVVYHELIEETRTRFTEKKVRRVRLTDRMVNAIFYHLFTYPRRLKLSLLPLRIMQKIGLWKLINSRPMRALLPAQFDKMQQMLPPRGPLWERKLRRRYPSNPQHHVDGKPRATVGLFAGCVGSVLFQNINRQTADILTHVGCQVVAPRRQKCCGAIHHHGGKVAKAEQFARANIDVFFPKGAARPIVDYVVNNIAGCGAMLKDYAHLLRDDPTYAERARKLVSITRDISELMLELNPPKPEHAVERTVTYHDACHLAHAQKVTKPPRAVLGWIKGLKVIALPESDMCCGAAGTYNLSQPAMARDLAERKINHIRRTQCDTCVTGNVGCAMQIQSEADRLGEALTVTHPVALLHEAYFGSSD